MLMHPQEQVCNAIKYRASSHKGIGYVIDETTYRTTPSISALNAVCESHTPYPLACMLVVVYI